MGRGRTFRCLAILDEFTRECLDIYVGHSIPSLQVIEVLGSFRDECLNLHGFGSLADARAVIEQYRQDYYQVRPHSSLHGRTPAEWAEIQSGCVASLATAEFGTVTE